MQKSKFKVTIEQYGKTELPPFNNEIALYIIYDQISLKYVVFFSTIIHPLPDSYREYHLKIEWDNSKIT